MDFAQPTTLISLAALFLAIVASVVAIIALTKTGKATEKIERLLSGNGKDAASLEDVILGQSKSIEDMDKEIHELFDISNKIHKLAFRGLHKIGLIRFNPFKDVGGNQSFSVAILDGHNSGFTITSLHTREGNHIYLKPVVRGESDQYPLTTEEKKAIAGASPIKENTQDSAKKKAPSVPPAA